MSSIKIQITTGRKRWTGGELHRAQRRGFSVRLHDISGAPVARLDATLPADGIHFVKPIRGNESHSTKVTRNSVTDRATLAQTHPSPAARLEASRR